jgi:secreted PhoX family phosphatase
MTDQIAFNDDYDSNTSGNPEFHQLFNQQMSRRDLIKKTAGGAVALTLAASLTGCSDNDEESTPPSTPATPNEPDLTATPKSLTFKPVDKNTLEQFTVAEGYDFKVLHAVGDPLHPSLPVWDENNIPSGVSYERRVGDNHDGMTFFGLNTSKQNFDVTV